MDPLDRRRAGLRTGVLGLAVAGTLSLLALPASAGPARSRAAARPALLPVEGSACLFPIPGQECSEEERRLCDTPPAPDPVVIDCHDPANAWVLEMVGECDMPHLSDSGVAGERERERPRDGACLDAESCGASRSAAAPSGSSLDYQPAIDRVPAGDPDPARRLAVPSEILRRHPGYPRDLEHPPKA
ncbi:MAG: hypothetical protein HY928_08700 [Elusimicrobia bacterium]|nr:hypothetical protein [Elusimicrobiota bacterium]